MGVARRTASDHRRLRGPLASVTTGLVIGAVEMIVAASFAALVFSGYLEFYFLDDGVGLYLGAAALALAIFAWRAGSRGVVGGLHAGGAAVIAIVSGNAVVHGSGSPSDVFLTSTVATLVATVLCGGVVLWLGMRRRGDVLRFVPYPVVGGYLAGTGWLLVKGGVLVASGVLPSFSPLRDLTTSEALMRWVPALAFGVLLLAGIRLVERPIAIPAGIAIGLALFAIAIVGTGSSTEEVRIGGWLLGPFDSATLWKTWTISALGGADWLAVLESAPAIVAAALVATLAILFDASRTELVLDRDLDTDRELRDAGVVNVASGAVGGVPGSHDPSLTRLAGRMQGDARIAGAVAALVPLGGALFGGAIVGSIPRAVVGGVLVFLGLAFIVEWVWDERRVLPPIEYAVVLVILAAFVVWGLVTGVALGLVLAVVLLAVRYGQLELVQEVPFGETYRSNVDRPERERAELRSLGGRVQILRVGGYVFFGSTNRLLERVRQRVEASPPRFLVIDLRRVTGVDSSAVVSFVKVMRLAEVSGFEGVFTAASDPVRAQLERGGVVPVEGIVSFEPDLDRGLQRCEDALLSPPGMDEARAEHPSARGPDGLPPGLAVHTERVSVPAGTVLIHQDDPPGDVYVLESGQLGVETTTRDGTRMRLRMLRPGVVVGEIALYTGVPRTADVVADVPSVVLRMRRDSIERLERDDPALAAGLHRWFAEALAERLADTQRSFDALLDR